MPKSTQRRPIVEADAQAPEPTQGAVCTPSCSCQRGCLGVPCDACCVAWEPEGAPGQATLLGCAGVLGMSMAWPGLETLASVPGPFGDFCHSHASGFSPAALCPLPAPQQPFSQLEAGSAGAHRVGDSGLVCGDRALQGWGQLSPSREQQPWWGWQPPPAVPSGMVAQQPLSQPPLPGEHGLHLASPSALASPPACRGSCPASGAVCIPPLSAGLWGAVPGHLAPATTAAGAAPEGRCGGWQAGEVSCGSSVL